jgi:DNA-binding MarR family transcriptional regulator
MAPSRGFENRPWAGQLLVRLLYQYRREAAVEAARLGYPDIRSPHMQVLAHISGRGIRLTELADRAHLSLAAASEFVSELEDLGYLERRPDRRDGRAKVIVPTRKGRSAFREGQRGAAAIERRWAALVGRDRFEQALEVLEQLLEHLGEVERAEHDRTSTARVTVA